MNSTLGDPLRILIVRLTAVGDCIHTMPIASALREKFPDAYLSWIVEGISADLVRRQSALDQVIALPRRWFKQSFRELLKIRSELQKQKFDIAIDAQGLTKSAAIAWISGAKRRIGYGGVDGREFSNWLNNETVEPQSVHVVDRNLELLKPLGVSSPESDFGLREEPMDALLVRKFLNQWSLRSGYVLINPGAGWPSKIWPATRFGDVAYQIGKKYGIPSVVVWAGEEERDWAETIVAGCGEWGHLAPQTTLPELAAFARRARLFISSDTGPLHLAAAVGTPCVGLFGPMPKERNGPYGHQHIAVQKMRLAGSSRDLRSASDESMCAIEVSHVVKACQELLERPAAHLAKSA